MTSEAIEVRDRLPVGASGLSTELRALAEAPGFGFVFSRRQTKELLLRAAAGLELAERELAHVAERELAVSDALIVATAVATRIEEDARARAVETMTEAEERRKEVEEEMRSFEAGRDAIRERLTDVLQAAVEALKPDVSELPAAHEALDEGLRELAKPSQNSRVAGAG